ncbi:ABC transporter substrate-binding protein [Diplocloster modestus]|uniref:Extracellular solute-binding protein n=1 Tax=Diplocloster modestus TaxID=2850322 RepID=A0ABS6KE86_9FIRM|nr:extracellular solute-binding protein [Diplocloster modestus]MBU9728836.1 extracellular solute-binding protein [Diplocloster modestus]
MKIRKVLAVFLAAVMAAGIMTGCGNKKAENTSGDDTQKPAQTQTAAPAATDQVDTKDKEPVTLNYWTWFPSTDQIDETIKAFEKENPDIKINMTVMESKAFQEKVPLALSTEEDIDIIGVQPSAFAEEVQDYLADLDELMPAAAGDDWKSKYSEKCLEQGNQLTDGKTKLLVLTNSGSMIGFYNVALLNEIGAQVPTTLQEYKAVAEKLKAKYPDKLAGVFAGKDAWVMDEMMLTVLGQQGDYYNKWRYDSAPVDSPEFIQAMNGLKKYFDEGVFSADILDLDYASATEEFTNGNALVYYMGSWEAPLLSKSLREKNGIDLEDVGAMALPVAEQGGKATVRSYIDSGIGVVDYSEKKEAAAKFVAYVTVGAGADIFGKQLTGTSAKKDFTVDESLFASDAAKDGWNTIVDLINTASADRNNVSGYSDVEGAGVQSVMNGTKSAEDVCKDLQKEWTSGKY